MLPIHYGKSTTLTLGTRYKIQQAGPLNIYIGNSSKDTDLGTAAHATHASSINNLTSYFLYTSVSGRKNATYFKLMSGK